MTSSQQLYFCFVLVFGTTVGHIVTKFEWLEIFVVVLAFWVSSVVFPEVGPSSYLHPSGKHPLQVPHVNWLVLKPRDPDTVLPALQSSTSWFLSQEAPPKDY